jgi:hypothetical protein
LTRASIHLRENLSKRDGLPGQGPGNDAGLSVVSRARCSALRAASQNRDPGFFEP